jgi:flagellar motility protein MotE (MotC chaperone)
MTQHPFFEGQTMFQSIGFHAALILNRLRNERAVSEVANADQDRRQREDAAEEEARRELAEVNRRLARLSARVREEPTT